jgi:hypothetical protein
MGQCGRTVPDPTQRLIVVSFVSEQTLNLELPEDLFADMIAAIQCAAFQCNEDSLCPVS